MRILLTGAEGFLGWHTRVRLTVEGHSVVPVTRKNWLSLSDHIADVDAIVHLAGINRGDERQVEEGNTSLAEDIASSLDSAKRQPQIVFSNTIQVGNGTAYGRGKEQASNILAAAAKNHGLSYSDLVLPNLFGEHGRPYYNSVVQTFIQAVINRDQPQVIDRPIALLHASRAAQTIANALTVGQTARYAPAGSETSVAAVLNIIKQFDALYANGDIPDFNDEFELDLFNTFRAALFPARYPICLAPRTDQRGSLTEIIRSHGGPGQTFISSTYPGKVRGEHFHLRKIERFIVLKGQAEIRLRRVFHDSVVSFKVSGNRLAAVDMPTMWAHSITNVGDGELVTLFWVNSLFDPNNPDTYPASVTRSPSDAGY